MITENSSQSTIISMHQSPIEIVSSGIRTDLLDVARFQRQKLLEQFLKPPGTDEHAMKATSLHLT